MTTVGHLFAGIDGFGIGLEAVGDFEARFTVELDDFSHSILRLRLGDDVEHHRDVRTFHPPAVDVLTGGFPCQDLSAAGKGDGITGERSGLWTEYARIIDEARPQAALIENVPMLLRRGMEVVVHDLVELGYSIEWDCLPAAAFGAPHLRDRVWIVAHRAPAPSIFGAPLQLFSAPWADLPLSPDGWHIWPRAGFVSGTELHELQPIAPKSLVAAGGVDLLPTPVANDVRGGVVRHLRNKLGWDEGDRTRITSLAVLARNDFRQPTDEQLAEARQLAAESGRANADKFAADVDPELEADMIAPPMFPTPTAHDGKNSGPSQIDRRAPGLATRAEFGLWPTPNAADGLGGRNERSAVENSPEGTRSPTRPSGAKAAISLRTAVLTPALWPTPRASGGKSGGEGTTYRRTPSQLAGTHGRYLQTEAIETDLEQGRIDEADVDRYRGDGGALNPAWVEWLMGFPIGWTDPAVPNDELTAHPWTSEPPGIPRTMTGVPHRRERLTALGNALVPIAAAWIGERLRNVIPGDDELAA